MNNAETGTIYPAKYYDASPTWYRWNKLSAADVFQLRQEPGFEGQSVWFWLNHPIQYVRLVGFICQIDMVAGGKYVLMTLDDSSGANIELKLEREVRASLQSGMKDYLPITSLENVTVTVDLGLPTVHLNSSALELGTVVIAEGQIESYLQGRQMALDRLHRVLDTRAEAEHWRKLAEWKNLVLSTPWTLSVEQRQGLDQKAMQEGKRELKHRRHRKKHSEKQRLVDEVREKKRQADEVEMNRGAIPGSEILKMPWDN